LYFSGEFWFSDLKSELTGISKFLALDAVGDTTPVYLAAQRGFSGAVTALAAAGADLDFSMPVSPFSGGVVDPQGSSRVAYAPVNTKVSIGPDC
jgi:hypothetical protein